MGTDALWFRGFGFPNCLEMFENEKSFHLMHFKLNLINVSVSTTSFDFKANRKFLNYPKLILSEHFKTKRIFVRFFIKKFCIFGKFISNQQKFWSKYQLKHCIQRLMPHWYQSNVFIYLLVSSGHVAEATLAVQPSVDPLEDSSSVKKIFFHSKTSCKVKAISWS